MSNIKIILTPDLADAIMTVMSGIEKGHVLDKLYSTLGSQFSRGYKYKLVESSQTHNVYGTPMVHLVAKRDA